MKKDIKQLLDRIARYITISLTTIAILILWQNCKVPDYPIENEESYSKIFMPMASDGAVEHSFAIKDEWTNIPFGVGYGGISPLAQNVQVDFDITPKQVEIYNQQNNTDYELPPEDSYKLNENTVEILAGQTGSNSISLNVNPLKLNGTKTYLLPVSIHRVSPDIAITEGLNTAYFIVNGFYETNPYDPLPKEDWQIVEVSSEQADAIGGLAEFCIDGDVNTCWLSRYSRDPDTDWRPQHPHHVTIDMNKQQTLRALQLFGRVTNPDQSSQDYLFPRNVNIELSDDGKNWESAGIFSTETSPEGAPEATVYFEQAIQGQYLRITVISSSSANGDTTGIAEIIAF